MICIADRSRKILYLVNILNMLLTYLVLIKFIVIFLKIENYI